MLNPKNLKNGESQYEKFFSSVKKCDLFQYDYRAQNGELFSCVKKSLDDCMSARDIWMINKNLHPLQNKKGE